MIPNATTNDFIITNVENGELNKVSLKSRLTDSYRNQIVGILFVNARNRNNWQKIYDFYYYYNSLTGDKIDIICAGYFTEPTPHSIEVFPGLYFDYDAFLEIKKAYLEIIHSLKKNVKIGDANLIIFDYKDEQFLFNNIIKISLNPNTYEVEYWHPIFKFIVEQCGMHTTIQEIKVKWHLKAPLINSPIASLSTSDLISIIGIIVGVISIAAR